MKIAFLIALAVSGLSLKALASESPTGAKHPCHQIKDACSAAGFFVGGHKDNKGKGLHKDCLQPILEGKSVAGVSVAADTVAACKANKEEHMAKKAK